MAQTAFASVGTFQGLLSGVQPSAFMWIMSDSEIGVGTVPLRPEFIVDLAGERVRRPEEVTLPPHLPSKLTPAPLPPRARLLTHGGRYLFDIKGKLVECASLKDMLKKGLLEIEAISPGMLEELSAVRPRTKRIVAKDARHLFEDQKLVKQFAAELKPGWFFGTNNSAPETKGWLQRACEIAKLQWGMDFDVSI